MIFLDKEVVCDSYVFTHPYQGRPEEDKTHYLLYEFNGKWVVSPETYQRIKENLAKSNIS